MALQSPLAFGRYKVNAFVMSHHVAWPIRLCTQTVSALALVAAGAAGAQQVSAPQIAVPVVQAVPQKSAGARLNSALTRLARNPQDATALKEAGQASLELGDAAAAIGFYQRALTIQPTDVALKSGLAGAYVLSEDPFTAIDLFDEAERSGQIDPARLADRGLAFDLIGDSQTAQTYYRQSLAGAPSEETLRRLALSQAISRDRKGMEQTLAPLLQQQDKAAWRTRSIGLAIMGQADEAEAIAHQTMPADMAAAITAYLRYMPRLTAAQQAAAGNLGRFPRAAEIGLDDPRVAAYTRSRIQVAKAGPAEDQSLQKRDAKPVNAVTKRTAAAVIPPPEPKVSRETPTASRPAIVVPQAADAPGAATAQAVSAPRSVAQPVLLAATEQPLPAKVEPVAASQPTGVRKPASLDEAFADLGPPSDAAEPKAGAVDVRTVRALPAVKKEPAVKETTAAKQAVAKGQPAKPLAAKDPAAKDKVDPKAKTDPKAKADPRSKDAKGKDAKGKPSHPSRIWVQIAAGRNKPALAFDWRKFVKEDPTVFRGQKPSVTEWGQTNRLLTGPFASAKEAEAFLAKVKKAGRAGAFVWTSPAGQVVDALPVDK